jgi:hypothetical protein
MEMNGVKGFGNNIYDENFMIGPILVTHYSSDQKMDIRLYILYQPGFEKMDDVSECGRPFAAFFIHFQKNHMDCLNSLKAKPGRRGTRSKEKIEKDQRVFRCFIQGN